LRKKCNWWWLLWVGLAALFLAGCMGKEEQWLQGKWARGNTHFVSEWNFNGGAYSSYFDYTNGVAPRAESGRYVIVETGEGYLVLELFQRQGSHPELLEENQRIRFNVNVAEDSIQFRGQSFERVVP
jgi:hypothetical protein